MYKINSPSLRSVADTGTEIINVKLHLFDVPKKLLDRQQWLLPQFLRRQAKGWHFFIQGHAPSPPCLVVIYGVEGAYLPRWGGRVRCVDSRPSSEDPNKHAGREDDIHERDVRGS